MFNGVPVGSHTNIELGRVLEHNDERALEYIAPARSPGSTITINTQVIIAERTQLQLVTNLSIYSGNTCSEGKTMTNAPTAFAMANGVLTGMASQKEGFTPESMMISLTIKNFMRKSTYEVNEDNKENRRKRVGIVARSNRKNFVDFYRDDINTWLSGGVKSPLLNTYPGN